MRCKGIIFRGKVDQFSNLYNKEINKDGVPYTHNYFYAEERRRLVLLKKESCRGCDKCKNLREALLKVGKGIHINFIQISNGKLYFAELVEEMDSILLTEIKDERVST